MLVLLFNIDRNDSRLYHTLSLSLSVYLSFNGHFSGGPGLAGTRMSPFWILLEPRVMEVVVTTGAIRHAKFQSNCCHQQTDTQFSFTGRMPFLLPNQQCQTLKGQISHIVCFQ